MNYFTSKEKEHFYSNNKTVFLYPRETVKKKSIIKNNDKVTNKRKSYNLFEKNIEMTSVWNKKIIKLIFNVTKNVVC